MKWLRKLFNLPPVPTVTPQGKYSAPQDDEEQEYEDGEEPGYFDMHWTIMKDGRAKLTTDWDSKFIEGLRKKGFTGSSEDQIIQKYIAMMHAQGMAEERGKGDDYK